MALTNAERQARHRERMKAKLAAASEPQGPLHNDDLLENLQFAYLVGERQAIRDALAMIEEKGVLAGDSGWPAAVEVLSKSHEKPETMTKQFFMGLVANAAAIMGNRLVMETYREYVATELKKQEDAKPSPVKPKRRKRVT